MQEAAHIGWTEPEFWATDPTPRQWARHVAAENQRVRREEERFSFLAYTVTRMSGKVLKKEVSFEEWLNPPQPEVRETEDGKEVAGMTFNPGVSAGVASGIAQLVAVAKKDKSFTDKFGGVSFEGGGSGPEDEAEQTARAVKESYTLEEQHAAAAAFAEQVRAVRRLKKQADKEKKEGGADD